MSEFNSDAESKHRTAQDCCGEYCEKPDCEHDTCAPVHSAGTKSAKAASVSMTANKETATYVI
jgi:hypothetical protein